MNTTVHTDTQTQTFISFNSHQKDIFCDSVIIDQTASMVGTTNNNKIIKLVKPRRPMEILKMLILRSRIHKEIRGNHILRKLGLKTPTIFQQGYGLIPQKDYRYIGFYIMENLVSKGLQESSCLFAKPCNTKRDIFINNLCQGLVLMRQRKIVFSDLTLANLFVDSHADITWIDTGVTDYRRRSKKRFQSKFNFSINRFIAFHENVLTPEETQTVRQILFT